MTKENAVISLLFHGTILSEANAPSSKPLARGLVESSQGFSVLVPDYQGYGAGKGDLHPYLMPEPYVITGKNAIRAAREFFEQDGIVYGKEFYIQGYSEGGYGAMAFQKAIESRQVWREEFPIAASGLGAGPYLLDRITQLSLAKEVVHPAFVVLLTLSYRYWYPSISFSFDQVFKPEVSYALVQGGMSIAQVNNHLPHRKRDLLQEEFIDDLRPEKDRLRIFGHLQNNSLVNGNWAPKTPTRLFHCRDDEIVPVQISEEVFEYFRQVNPKSPVTLVVIESGSQAQAHGNCPLYFGPLEFFLQHRKGG